MPADAQIDMFLSLLRAELSNRPRAIVLVLTFSGALGAIIAALAPAATANLPLSVAFAHWVLHILGAIVIVGALGFGLRRLGLRLRWSIFMAILFLPLCLAPFSLGIEMVIAYMMGDPGYQPDGVFEELRKVAVPAIGIVALIVLVLIKGSDLLRDQQARILTRFAAEPNIRTVFRDLPPELGDDLLSVSAHDHYIIVRTTLGRAMLSAKFADTVEKLARFQGTQVHRSHWVRTKHVTRIVPNGSSYICLLTDQSEIPVSRRRHNKLRQVVFAKAGADKKNDSPVCGWDLDRGSLAPLDSSH